MIAGVVRSFSLSGKKQSAYALNRVLKLSAGAGGEMEPFYALGVNVARQVGGELKTILSKEEISAMLEVSKPSARTIYRFIGPLLARYS